MVPIQARVAAAVRDHGERWKEERHLFRRLIRVRGPSDPHNLERMGNLVETFVDRVMANDAAGSRLGPVCRAAIERAGRLGNHGAADRYLDIQIIEDADRLTLIIQDELSGFDEAAAEAAGPVEPEVREALNLIASCMDRVDFQNSGHRLTLIKYKRRESL